jgi:hypothetical protein
MSNWSLRLRALCTRQFTVAIAVCLLLALAGGWTTYTTHTGPEVTTEQRTVTVWETTGQFAHTATVTESNAVYPTGTTLSNRSIYLTAIAPQLDGTYRFEYGLADGQDRAESGALNGTVSLAFVLRSTEDRSDTTTVIWQTTRPLTTTTVESVEPGESVRVPFRLDMNDTTSRSARIDEQLGNPPGQPTGVVRATVRLRGTIGGDQVEETTTHTLPLDFDSGTYRPASVGTYREAYNTTQTVTVEQPPPPLSQRAGGVALLVVPLGLLVGLVTARQRDVLELTTAERERLAYEEDRRDFDEWISPIRLPEAAFDLPRAEATSLGALVDFAIDTDNSVVDDPDDPAYYVVHDGYLYTYHPPQVDAEPTGESVPTGDSSADAAADHDDTSSGGRDAAGDPSPPADDD